MTIINMTNNEDQRVEPDLKYMVDHLLAEIGIEGKVTQDFNTICEVYHQYLNSDNKAKRLEMLLALANAAKSMRATIGSAFKDRPIPNKLVRDIRQLCKPRLSNYYLNWQQICQFFFYSDAITKENAKAANLPEPTAQELYQLKMHHLTALYRVLIDLEEVAMVTEAEPDYEVMT